MTSMQPTLNGISPITKILHTVHHVSKGAQNLTTVWKNLNQFSTSFHRSKQN